ncbi:unnamed protein product [Prunus armeniaca]
MVSYFSRQQLEQPTAQLEQHDEPPVRRSQRARKSAIPTDYTVYLQEVEFDIGDEDDPKSFDQAMKSAQAPLWHKAMLEELNSMAKNGVWTLTYSTSSRKPIGCKWVFKTKRDSQGRVEGLKALLASRQWYLKFDEVVTSFGFIENKLDDCIYLKVYKSSFDMKYFGEAHCVLGIEIMRNRSRKLLGLSQLNYINKVLKRFNMEACSPGDLPIGKARDLAYLHEESTLKVVHRDIKATNVLLDKNLTPKISDFGLAKLDEEDNTHISTRIAGTYGMNNTTYRGKEKIFYLLDWAQLLKGQGNLMELVDPRLCLDFNKEEIMLTINVALLCCNVTATVRPTMSSVVSMLEGRAAVQELVSDPNASSFEIEAMRKHFQSSFGRNTGKSQTQTAPTEGTWTGSSSSAHDLYPVKPDSTYWDNRK